MGLPERSEDHAFRSTYAHWIGDMEDRSNKIIEASFCPAAASAGHGPATGHVA